MHLSDEMGLTEYENQSKIFFIFKTRLINKNKTLKYSNPPG